MLGRCCPAWVAVAGLLAQFVAFHAILAQHPGSAAASVADWPAYGLPSAIDREAVRSTVAAHDTMQHQDPVLDGLP